MPAREWGAETCVPAPVRAEAARRSAPERADAAWALLPAARAPVAGRDGPACAPERADAARAPLPGWVAAARAPMAVRGEPACAPGRAGTARAPLPAARAPVAGRGGPACAPGRAGTAGGTAFLPVRDAGVCGSAAVRGEDGAPGRVRLAPAQALARATPVGFVPGRPAVAPPPPEAGFAAPALAPEGEPFAFLAAPPVAEPAPETSHPVCAPCSPVPVGGRSEVAARASTRDPGTAPDPPGEARAAASPGCSSWAHWRPPTTREAARTAVLVRR
ncbi:hypothetical protein TUSST3_89870 [Streptomyces sp. TUS-ST3]|nr:hypothetical protein TUSST3_89870 [Streptomyces sp. TUS-ST3]